MGIHRLREAGLAPHLMDDLDERSLNLEEIHELCWRMFLGKDDRHTLPHPQHNRDQFFDGLKKLVDHEGRRWNPVKKRVASMIDIKKLDFLYDKNYEDYYECHPPSFEVTICQYWHVRIVSIGIVRLRSA